MRISKETFNMLLEKVRLYIEKQDTKMRQSISAEERLDVTLRFLATKSMRSFTNSSNKNIGYCKAPFTRSKFSIKNFVKVFFDKVL
jgi:hypothetical protein